MQGRRWLLLFSALLLSLPALAVDGNARAGKLKVSMCVGCHGIPNYQTSFPQVYHVPKIGGQHADYIVTALKEYKSGARKNATMYAIAAGLSEQDMADVAEYYATSGVLPPQKGEKK